jgi:uncharacterized protein (DUF2062 family)
MPRKHFRKFLPSHESIRGNRHLSFLGSGLHHPNLWHLNRRSVAGGVAIGMLCGMIPGPIQMVSAAVLAVLLRVNLPVAAAATWYVNPFTIVPLYYLAYRVGALVTGDASGPSAEPNIELTLGNIGQWVPRLTDWIGRMGKPFVLGLFLLGTALSAGSYAAVRGAWRISVITAWRRRRRKRRAAKGVESDK